LNELEAMLLFIGICFLLIGLFFCYKIFNLLKTKHRQRNYLLITGLVTFFIVAYAVFVISYFDTSLISFFEESSCSAVIFFLGSIFVFLITLLNYKTYEEIFDFQNLQTVLEDLVKKRTKELSIEKQRLSQIIKYVGDGIITTDAENNIVLMNESVEKLLDIEVDTLVGLPYNALMSKVYNIGEKSFIRVPVQQGDNYTKNLIISPKESGSERYIEEKITSFYDDDGILQGHIIVLNDFTHIFEFDQMRKKLISSASHELRTPITIIKQSIKSLNKYGERIDEKTKTKLLNMIGENAVLLSDIVEGLELISNIDQKKLKLQCESFSLYEVISTQVEKLSRKWQKKNINIEIHVEEDIELLGDQEALTKVFRCLIDNAIKYSKQDGEVIIKAQDNYLGKYNPQEEPGILIQIIDKGIGISKEYFDKIFERFFRTKDVNTTSGVGIGLAIAKSIIKLHNGDIFIESELDKGSTFSVFLPKMNKV